ncbi:MAG: ribonuclease HII [Candidatus Omnitrophica bacterium CG11_big_fil_rev_8_21_14_0_20_42_13]|uniref:Ribonuclease HII n=1 Tax=Candidatus Ghiorseimicrobium undicola TaxID=1974746 RepID=A0A2H0LWS6_9BACT|nr:MAG: ribonuclease HII [Candidatus Omnitrophica bacterium CG11_big_fil_rev_8_21_14_0_20_42_13]
MPNFYYEADAGKKGFDLVGGVDEAGRGPLAGPVVAAAVILTEKKINSKIDDSKALSAVQRENAYKEITDFSVVGIGIIPETIIDSLNILQATLVAMENAVISCARKAAKIFLSGSAKKNLYFLVDGGNIGLKIPYGFRCIVSGDKKSRSIAAASIVAKVTRDRIMQIYDKVYPSYGFSRHKGYPTKEHIANLRRFGPVKIHRKTFYPVSELKCGIG